jgi:DUF4097 and DUF4098 domain-containing protein YvlB
MRQSPLRFQTIAFVGLALLLGPWAGGADAKVYENFEQTLAFHPGGQFSIENVNGSITVETWNEGTVRIEAEKEADTERLLQEMEIIVEGEGDHVRVETRYPRRTRRGESGHVDYTIRIPAEANVDVQTVNGRVDVTGIQGHVDASTTNGSVHVEDIVGEAQISTTNGSIKARYRQAFDGNHHFSTTNGSVTLYLPTDAGGTIDAKTVNGSITTDFPATVNRMSKNRLKGTFGDGGSGSFEIETVNGSVKIRKF